MIPGIQVIEATVVIGVSKQHPLTLRRSANICRLTAPPPTLGSKYAASSSRALFPFPTQPDPFQVCHHVIPAIILCNGHRKVRHLIAALNQPLDQNHWLLSYGRRQRILKKYPRRVDTRVRPKFQQQQRQARIRTLAEIAQLRAVVLFVIGYAGFVGEHGAQGRRVSIVEGGRLGVVTESVGGKFGGEEVDDWDLMVGYGGVEHAADVVAVGCESGAVDTLHGLAISMFACADDRTEVILSVRWIFWACQSGCLGQASIALGHCRLLFSLLLYLMMLK